VFLLPATLLTAYLIGAIPFGYLVARCRGVDILHQGSGNIGATNVGRLLGRKYGILVFLLDFAKGALPVAVAEARPLDTDWPPQILGVTAGIAAFLGHLFPVYLRFRGGKGVATSAGVVAVLVPLPTFAALLTWLAVVLATRYVSLASLTAALVLCAFRLAFTPDPWGPQHLLVTLFCFLAAVLVWVRHHANLRRLWNGSENQLKDGPAMLQLSKTLHVLALGLCFGTLVFFTLAGVLLVDAFEQLAVKPASERPYWFPLPSELDKDPPSSKFPNPLRKEQGLRAFGHAVNPLFPWYYGIQTGCVLLGLATAWPWCSRSPGGRVHRWRVGLLVAALFTLGVGWWLEYVVNDLREPRNRLTEVVVREKAPTGEQIKQAEDARAAFGMWHGFSLLQNFATLLLVGAAMALAAQLPVAPESQVATSSTKAQSLAPV
jgi:acyl-phosphate glycerol 3-phosphate acyltransferase